MAEPQCILPSDDALKACIDEHCSSAVGKIIYLLYGRRHKTIATAHRCEDVDLISQWEIRECQGRDRRSLKVATSEKISQYKADHQGKPRHHIELHLGGRSLGIGVQAYAGHRHAEENHGSYPYLGVVAAAPEQ